MQSETNREEILEEDKYLSRFYYTFGSCPYICPQPVTGPYQISGTFSGQKSPMPELCRILHRMGNEAHGNVKSGQSLVKMPSGYKIICFYFGTDKSAVSCYN